MKGGPLTAEERQIIVAVVVKLIHHGQDGSYSRPRADKRVWDLWPMLPTAERSQVKKQLPAGAQRFARDELRIFD